MPKKQETNELKKLLTCFRCGKKLKQCWTYDIPNKKLRKEIGWFNCKCNPKTIISVF